MVEVLAIIGWFTVFVAADTSWVALFRRMKMGRFKTAKSVGDAFSFHTDAGAFKVDNRGKKLVYRGVKKPAQSPSRMLRD